MGAGSSSSFSSLPSNDLLKRFVGNEVITYNDPFWNTLLSFASRVPRTSGDSRLLDESVTPLFRSLAANTPLSGNLATLVTVFLARALELEESARCENSVFVWQAHNALFILRVVIKLLLENYPEHKAQQLIECTNKESGSPAVLNSADTTPLVQRLVTRVVAVLVELPVTATTHTLHLEAVTTLTVLLSGHVCAKDSPTGISLHFIFGLLQRGCDPPRCGRLVAALLRLLLDRPSPPPDPDSSGSFVAGLAAGLWSVLTLGLASGSEASSDGGAASPDAGLPTPLKPVTPSPLADQAELLLLVLATHAAEPDGGENYFSTALFSARNDAADPLAGLTSPPDPPPPDDDVAIPFAELYSALNATLHTEHTTLLLYLLLHNNESFRTYLLSVSDVESVVLPLLQTLHHAPRLSSHHVYMALIIILMLSEDNSFNASLHDIPVASVPWYCERPLSNISLGDLLILVLIRTITFNMTKMRDRYLHSNCLAALANMSSQFRSVHQYVCQRIIGLLETLSRRHCRVMAAIRERDNKEEDLLSDLGVLEEVLRMVLEILNSTLTHQLGHNSQLLYTLLYKRQVFLPFSTQPNFSDVCMNIDVVLNYLMNRLEKTTTDPSVADVQAVIEQGVLQLPKDRLRKFPELKFKYVEESSPEEFFIPYVWTLVYQSSGLYWDEDNVALFDPSSQDT